MKSQRYIFVSALALMPAQLWAVDGSVSVGVGLEHTDNSLLTNINQRSELGKNADFGFQLTHEGESIAANASYVATHSAYDKSTQDDQTSVTGEVSVVYEQIKEQLFWTIENSRSNVLRDRQLADLESNREDRSISTISPALVLKVTPVDAINTSIFYSDIAYQDTEEQDSSRMGGSIAWAHSFSKIDQVVTGFSYQEVMFDLEEADYEYYLATIGYQAELSRLSYNISAGYNESRREVADDVDGVYFSASATYSREPSSWQVNISHELTDTSQQNNNGDITGIGVSNNLGADIDIFERSSIQLTYSNSAIVCGACVVNASIIYEREDYETLENDGDEFGISLGLNYSYSRLLSVGANVQYTDFIFTGANARGEYDILEYGVNVSRTITQALNISFQLAYSERNSDNSTRDYDELRGGVRLQYTYD